jgi:hypothetical protein
MLIRLLIVGACLLASVASPTAQSDLDSFMARVLSRRDENWKKLQQYTLVERESIQITALVVFRIFGFEREYLWFPRAGFFVRSPLTADGVEIAEEERRRQEERWLTRAQRREQRDIEKKGDYGQGDRAITGAVDDVIQQTFEPGFIRSANFLRFKFDEGQYALVGREKMLGRDVLRIEYYPKILFDDDKDRQDGQDRRNRSDDDRDEEFDAKMEKVSQVTLWIDPGEHQILRYEFRLMEMDFLPGRAIVRVDGARATMQMGEPFRNVWLPSEMTMRFRMASAAGPLEARYEVEYDEYRLPTTEVKIK